MAVYFEKQMTASTPYILIDEARGYLRFEGESFHENVIEFYQDVCDWLEGYLQTDFHSLTFDCEMRYFNSSTTKLLYNMLMEMDDHAGPDRPVTVNWLTTADNEIIIECGEDFRDEVCNLQFNLIIR